jgi:5-methylcytosine-specific restriction endonuclease McrA
VPIKPLDIFERDRWICQICKKRVSRIKKAPHPLSPSLDHIIPMSCEGGDHVPENVQLAHFHCNSVKGAKGGTVQLKLIA